MTVITKIIITGILFLVTIASGIALSKTGRPLNPMIFNIHKLIAIAGVILTGMIIYNLQKKSAINFILISLIILSLIFTVALFASGGFLSFDKPAEVTVLRIHNISMLLTVICTAAAVYLLYKKSI
jgi:hypothetical protein